MLNVSIRRIMSTSLVTASMDDPLYRIKEIFDHHGFHHVLVVEEMRLVGIISDRDLLKALSPHLGKASETTRDLASLNKRAHQIMSRALIVLRDDASIRDAIDTFNQHRISCIPIVDAARRPVGIVSWRDVFKALDPAER
jgi:acetoin utilization protein AcuB